MIYYNALPEDRLTPQGLRFYFYQHAKELLSSQENKNLRFNNEIMFGEKILS